jgi:hypothetical protein
MGIKINGAAIEDKNNSKMAMSYNIQQTKDALYAGQHNAIQILN